MHCSFNLRMLSMTLLAGLALPAVGQTIERVKLTDNELSCAQIHAETGEMDRVITAARAAEGESKSSADAAGAANVAAEVAGRTGLFGQLGGLTGALLGQVATQSAASAVKQSSTDSARAAAERAKQAQARKEYLVSMFLAKECRASDLSHEGKPYRTTIEASATPSASVIAAPVPQTPPLAVPDLTPADFLDALDSYQREEIAKVRRVAIGGFRVAFVVKATAADSVRASYRGGGVHNSGVSTRIEMTLRNVEIARMQALADSAYQEFLTRLTQAGVEIVPYKAVEAHKAYAGISFAKGGGTPYATETGGRSYVVLAPTGMKLWFGQAEPLGDQGVFGTGNGVSAAAVGYDMKAVVVNPMLVVDFAETASGRNKGFFGLRDRTDVEAKSAISLRKGKGMSQLSFFARSAPIDTAYAAGQQALKETVAIAGDFGELVNREESSNRGLVVGLGALGLSGGPVREVQRNDLNADPARYDALAAAALAAGSRLYVRTITDWFRN